ncbi:MAG: type II toxin-antitoxin system RelE/ParE family toxin [Candidatus Thermoplasmatota archaeon]
MKIRGEINLYRIRLGKHRILYEIDRENNRVIIIKIEKRSKIYDRI